MQVVATYRVHKSCPSTLPPTPTSITPFVLFMVESLPVGIRRTVRVQSFALNSFIWFVLFHWLIKSFIQPQPNTPIYFSPFSSPSLPPSLCRSLIFLPRTRAKQSSCLSSPCLFLRRRCCFSRLLFYSLLPHWYPTPPRTVTSTDSLQRNQT